MLSTGKLLFYDLEGKCTRVLSHFSNRALIRDVDQLSNGHYVCYRYDASPAKKGDNPIGLWETDATGKYFKNYIDCEEEYPPVFNFQNSYFQPIGAGDTLYIRDAIFSDLYRITKDSLEVILDFNLVNSVLDEYKGLSEFPEGKPGYALCNYAYFKNGKCIMRWTDENGEKFMCFYDLRTGVLRFTEPLLLEPEVMDPSWPVDCNLDNAMVWIASSHGNAIDAIERRIR